MAAILLGGLIVARWERTIAARHGVSELMALKTTHRFAWPTVFLPLAQSLLTGRCVWSALALAEIATASLSDDAWKDSMASHLSIAYEQFADIASKAQALIAESVSELAWQLKSASAHPTDSEWSARLALVHWLLGEAPEAYALVRGQSELMLSTTLRLIRQSLVLSDRDPCLDLAWKKVVDPPADVDDGIATIYYRLTALADATDSGVLDMQHVNGPPSLADAILRAATDILLSRSGDEVWDVLVKATQRPDELWNNHPVAFVRVFGLLLERSYIESDPARIGAASNAFRWELEKIASEVGDYEAWRIVVQGEGASPDTSMSLAFSNLTSRSSVELTTALELLERQRAGGLAYALSVSPRRRDREEETPSHTDMLKWELRALRYLQGIGRLPLHRRRYTAPLLTTGSVLSLDELLQDESRIADRRREILTEITAQEGRTGLDKPPWGRSLLEFTQALREGISSEPAERSDSITASQRLSDLAEEADAVRKQDDPQAARRKLEDLLTAATKDLPGSDVVAKISRYLGHACQAMDDYDTAIIHYERALEIHVGEFGLFDPSVGIDRFNLGTAHVHAERFVAGGVELERAVGVDEVVYGSDHTEVANDLETLGEALWLAGHGDRALSCQQRAHSIRTKAAP
jgi:hypothetical protein